MMSFIDSRSSSCSKSQYGGLGFHLSDISDAQIRGTEIIAPLADAMGFVDGDEANVGCRRSFTWNILLKLVVLVKHIEI